MKLFLINAVTKEYNSEMENTIRLILYLMNYGHIIKSM